MEQGGSLQEDEQGAMCSNGCRKILGGRGSNRWKTRGVLLPLNPCRRSRGQGCLAGRRYNHLRGKTGSQSLSSTPAGNSDLVAIEESHRRHHQLRLVAIEGFLEFRLENSSADPQVFGLA